MSYKKIPLNANKFIIKLVAMMKVLVFPHRNSLKSSIGAKMDSNLKFIMFNFLRPKFTPNISAQATTNPS